jgi:hypothetical protein
MQIRTRLLETALAETLPFASIGGGSVKLSPFGGTDALPSGGVAGFVGKATRGFRRLPLIRMRP